MSLYIRPGILVFFCASECMHVCMYLWHDTQRNVYIFQSYLSFTKNIKTCCRILVWVFAYWIHKLQFHLQCILLRQPSKSNIFSVINKIYISLRRPSNSAYRRQHWNLNSHQANGLSHFVMLLFLLGDLLQICHIRKCHILEIDYAVNSIIFIIIVIW